MMILFLENNLNNMRNLDLYKLKAKYFTLKYANIKSFNDFKWYNWDFSVDSNNLNSLISALKNKKN